MAELIENDAQPSYPNTGPQYFLIIKVGDQIFKALIDTGVSPSYIGPDLRQLCLDMGMPLQKKNRTLISAFGYPIAVSEHYTVTITYNGSQFTTKMSYFPELKYDAIVGINFLERANLQMFLMGQQVANATNAAVHEEDDDDGVIVAPLELTRPIRPNNNRMPVPDDPFEGITLDGLQQRRGRREFIIQRPWGRINVRVNAKGTKAFLRFRGNFKSIDIPNN